MKESAKKLTSILTWSLLLMIFTVCLAYEFGKDLYYIINQ